METLEGLDAGHFIGARHMRARHSKCRGHLIDLTHRADVLGQRDRVIGGVV